MLKCLILSLVVMVWAFPAHATMTVLAHAKTAENGAIPCVVSLDGSKAFRLERTVPAGTADLETWLNANVPVADEAAWKANALESDYAPAVVPEEWTHNAFDFADLPPKLRAILKTLLDENNALRDEINVLRALHSLSDIPQRTGPQAISAVQTKLNE